MTVRRQDQLPLTSGIPCLTYKGSPRKLPWRWALPPTTSIRTLTGMICPTVNSFHCKETQDPKAPKASDYALSTYIISLNLRSYSPGVHCIYRPTTPPASCRVFLPWAFAQIQWRKWHRSIKGAAHTDFQLHLPTILVLRGCRALKLGQWRQWKFIPFNCIKHWYSIQWLNSSYVCGTWLLFQLKMYKTLVIFNTDYMLKC